MGESAVYPFRHRLRRCHLPQGDGFFAVAGKFPAYHKGVPLGELANAVSLRGFVLRKRPRPLRRFRASSPKGRALGSPRKLHLFANASPFGRGGCERSEQTERARTLPIRTYFFFLNVSFCIFFALRYKVSRTFLIFHRNVMTFFVKSGILYLAGTVGPQPLPRT